MIAAGLTSLALMGNYAYFGTSPIGLRNGLDWIAILICGVVGGLAGGLFSRILIVAAQRSSTLIGRRIKSHPLGFAVVCGLAAAICGIAPTGRSTAPAIRRLRLRSRTDPSCPWASAC